MLTRARSCIWDGLICSSFKDSNGKPFHQNFGNLSFGFYFNWFNPMGHKITGKHHSLEPSEPTVLQMNNMLLPLVCELGHLWHSDIQINTPRIQIQFGNCLATHCTVPQSSVHSATYLEKTTIPSTTAPGHYAPLKAKSKNLKLGKDVQTQWKAFFKTTGVHWLVLNKLPYWNSINFTANYNYFAEENYERCLHKRPLCKYMKKLSHKPIQNLQPTLFLFWIYYSFRKLSYTILFPCGSTDLPHYFEMNLPGKCERLVWWSI
ncbi:uncharacterized protein VP01_3644g2 [Puccinia sorghi]|uniref:Uncharacterized protein n=1 Tax=Puccinia sorghi TaxID=27349 RepID=A0A0L6UUQ5_9BASI|nr:uncharacterized protein VP01_3644g2 [Puccinia sorghi]